MASTEKSYREMLEGMDAEALAFELLKLQNEIDDAAQTAARLSDAFGSMIDVFGERFAPTATAAAHARWIAIMERRAA